MSLLVLSDPFLLGEYVDFRYKTNIAGVVTAGILSSLGFVFNNIDTLKTENAEQKAVINELVKDLEEAEDDIDTLRAMHNDILWQLGGNS